MVYLLVQRLSKPMKNVTAIRISLLMGIFLMLGLGCKGLSDAEQNAIRPITLTYWTVNNDVALLEEFAAQYKQIRPYVTVNIRSIREEDFDTQLIEALADDRGPDIVSLDVTNIAEHRHRLAKMPPSVEVATVYQRGTISKETVVEVFTNPMPTRRGIETDYVGAVFDDAVVGNTIYGLPLAIDTLAVYYNRDLLDRAGIAEPPQDWDEFLEAVRNTTQYSLDSEIVQAGVAAGTMNNIPNSFELFSLLMMQNGVTLSIGNTVTFNRGLTSQNILTHPAAQALRFYTDFSDPTKDVYTWNSSMPNARDSFVRGETAFYFGFARERQVIKQRAPQMKLEVIPVPQLTPNDPLNIASYNLETVLKKSQNKDEAWDFVRFITRPDKVLAYTQKTGQPSPYRSQIQDQLNDPVLEPFASQSLTMRNWYKGKDKEAVVSAFDTMVRAYMNPVLSREQSVEEYIEQAINRAAQIIQQTY